MDIIHSLSLMDDLTHAWVSILNCKWPDGHSGGRDLWQDTDPLASLAPGKKETAEETLRFWMEHWLDCPFGQELVHCCLQVLGCIPGAKGDGYVSQWRLWLLLQQDCLHGCMMHGNCLAGSAAGSWWGQVLWWKSRLHGNDLVRVFYSQTLSHSPAAVDIAVGTSAVAAGMHLFREQVWGQKVPLWIQTDREWLVPMAAWFPKLAESLPCITCWSLRCMISW